MPNDTEPDEPEVIKGWAYSVPSGTHAQQDNLLVAHACAPFATASDGEDAPHSPGRGVFTTALVQVLPGPTSHAQCKEFECLSAHAHPGSR